MTEALTQSKVGAYRRCPRYFYHRHELHLALRAERRGRRRGTVFGSMLFAVQEYAAGLGVPSGPAIEDVRDLVEAKAGEMMGEFIPGDQDDQDSAELEMTKLVEIAVAYIGQYGVDRRRELVFDMPLVNPLTTHQSRTFARGGKIDGLRVVGEHQAVIVEDKLTQSIQKVMIDKLPLDLQIMEYVSACNQMGWHAEVEYRHTRYPGINPKGPKEYKTKPDYPGETLGEFAVRLREDIASRPEFYFVQQRVVLDPVSILEADVERWSTAKSILRSRQLQRQGHPVQMAWPRSTSHCLDYGGCEYIPLCTRVDGAENLYVVTGDNPELAAVR